jgi:hypothetical protein
MSTVPFFIGFFSTLLVIGSAWAISAHRSKTKEKHQ